METGESSPPLYSVETIVAQGLCMGCGLCQSVAGPDTLRLVMSAEGGERPAVLKPLDEATLRLVNAICPGIKVEGYTASLEKNPPDIDTLWGPTRFMAIGHASDPDVRFHASSGGALSALGLHLLKEKKVEFIVHVAASEEQPLRTSSHISFDAAQVMEASGSRYGPAAPLTGFKAVLDRGQPFAFIGKACDISAIRNYAKVDPRVDELLRYTMNFYCGGVSEFGKTIEYVRKIGRVEEDVTHLRYRGDGCPGAMIMRTRYDEEFRFNYNEMWEDERRWQLQFRCKICPDSIGDLADISVADVWPGRKPITDEIGFNGFIARTERGLELLQDAVRCGDVTLTEDLTYDGLMLAQGSHANKKQALTSRFAAMRDAGVITPTTLNLRLDLAAGMMSEEARADNYTGMQERLLRGDNVEALPEPLAASSAGYRHGR